MIAEPQPVAAALEACQPGESDDIQQLVQIAFYENVNPRKGFDWVLGRFGICNAITTVSSQELPHTPEVKEYCVRQLVRALHAELCERLGADIQRREGSVPATKSVRELLAGRDWLGQGGVGRLRTAQPWARGPIGLHVTPAPGLELAP